MFENLELLIEEGIKTHAFPGAVVAVGDADGVMYKKAFGYSRVFKDDAPYLSPDFDTIPDDAEKMTVDKVFDMASCSKILATTPLALQAIEEGKMTLFDSIFRFIDGVPDDKRDICISHLMTHTSGIPAHFLLENECETPDGAVKAILSKPLNNPIGAKVEYTCMGYILLGKILEQVYGKPLDVLAEEKIYKPLGMVSTCFNPLKKGITDIVPTEYNEKLGKYKCGEVHDENALFMGGVSGNAGIFSTVDDLIKYATSLSRFGEGMMCSRTLEIASENHTEGKGDDRGLGFLSKGKELSSSGDLFAKNSIGHTGYTGTSIFVDSKSRIYFILLTNRVHYTRQNAKMFRLRRMMHNAALSEGLKMRRVLCKCNNQEN